MKKPAAAAAGGILVLAALVAIYTGFVRRDMSDFGVPYRNAQRILRGETLYRLGDGHLQYKYAPVSALFYAPLAFLPVETAKIVWFILEVLLLAGIGCVGWRILPTKRKPPAFVIGLGLLAMLKFLGREIELGQVNLLIIFLLVLMTAASLAKRDAWAGALWAVSIFFKPYALVFLPYFLLKKRGRILASGAAVLAAGVFLPAAFYGFRGNLEVHREWIARLSDSTPVLLAVGDNASLYAFMLKTLSGAPETIIRLLWAAAGAILAVVFLWMMRISMKTERGETASRPGRLQDSNPISLPILPSLQLGKGGMKASLLKVGGAIPEPAGVLEASFLLVLIPLFSPLGWYYNYLYALPACFVLLNAWPLLSGAWKGIVAADLILIGATLREVLGAKIFHFYTHRSLVVVNFLVVLAALGYVRIRKID